MRNLALSILVAGILLPSTALAQRFIETPGYDGEGMPYRDCSEEGGGEIEEEIPTSPAGRDAALLPSGLTREQAEALRQQQQELQRVQIAQFDELLATLPADYPRRAEVLFRRAEALRELADADYLVARTEFNECIGNWYSCASDAECFEPLPDYEAAIENYKDVIRNHPNYDRTDEVTFRLGESLMENDEEADGIQYLTRLVSSYPGSQFIPDAHLLIADHYFDNDLLVAARQNYDQVILHPESDLYNYALYMLAWVDINEDQHMDALNKLQQVVRNIDGAADQRMDFRTQALNDMLGPYAAIDNGWQLAREYYETNEGEETMRRQLGRLSTLYDEEGQDENRIAVLDYFRGRYATDALLPQWDEQILDSLTKIGVWDRYEDRARAVINELDPVQSWAQANRDDQRALSNARLLSESTLLFIINRNYQEGERLSEASVKRELFGKVAADYDQFFQRFPDSREAYDQRFFYAELLFKKLANGGSRDGCADDDHFLTQDECEVYLRGAGDQYRAVVEMQPDPEAEYAHDSAVGALEVYDTFMVREVPDIDAPIPPADQFDLSGSRAELGTASQDYVDIVGWFAELYPEDELIPAASWRAAALYLRANQIEEAGQRFETIIEHHPGHRFAFDAALAAFVCYRHVENWESIEHVARRILVSCEDSQNRRNANCDPARFQRAIAYAMNEQSDDLMEEAQAHEINGDEDAARASRIAAAEKRVALYREFPDSEWSPVALFNAAATYEAAREITTSVGLYNEFLTNYGEHEFVPDAVFTLGLIHESQANYAAATEHFERVDQYEAYENRSSAIYNAARLYEAMSRPDDAIRLYDHYATLEPTAPETNDLGFVIANIERDRGNLVAADQRYEQVIATSGSDQVRRLAATYARAQLMQEQDDQRGATRLFGDVYDQFGRGTMAFGEDGLPAGWTVAPGANFADEAERTAVLPMAAEAAFMLAEPSYLEARASGLDYPPGRFEVFVDKLVERAELRQEAEQIYRQVYEMGDAEWAVAAMVRIGQSYSDFFQDVMQSEPPDYDQCLDMGGSYDQCDRLMENFDEQLYEYGDPFARRAMLAFEQGRSTAEEYGVYTEWTQVLMQEMNELDNSYRLGDAGGMRADSSSDPFISTNYILDLADKLAAFSRFTPVPAAVDGVEQQMLEGAQDAVETGTDGAGDAVRDALEGGAE